jgi:hypothetical protein
MKTVSEMIRIAESVMQQEVAERIKELTKKKMPSEKKIVPENIELTYLQGVKDERDRILNIIYTVVPLQFQEEIVTKIKNEI